jgi:hypothetical protein
MGAEYRSNESRKGRENLKCRICKRQSRHESCTAEKKRRRNDDRDRPYSRGGDDRDRPARPPPPVSDSPPLGETTTVTGHIPGVAMTGIELLVHLHLLGLPAIVLRLEENDGRDRSYSRGGDDRDRTAQSPPHLCLHLSALSEILLRSLNLKE